MKNILLISFFLSLNIYSYSQDKETLEEILIGNYYKEITGKGEEINGQRTGKWTLYFGDTEVKYAVGEYHQGLKNGEWTTFLSNGKHRSTGFYENGKLLSITVYTDSKDTTLTITSIDGIDVSTTLTIDTMIRELYVFALKVGINENGTLLGAKKIVNLLASKQQTGIVKFWEFDEILRQKFSTKNGIIEKEIYKYQRNKISFTTTYYNDIILKTKRNDFQTNMVFENYFFANGEIKQERSYLNRNGNLIKTGKWTSYHENGKKKLVVPYNREGELHGKLKQWNKEGEVIKEEKYKKGELMEKKI